MGQITIQGRPVKVSDDFFKLSPVEQDATVDEIAAELGSQPSEKPQHEWSETLGNLGPSAVNRVKSFWDMVTSPVETAEGMAAMPGGAAREIARAALPKDVFEFLDSFDQSGEDKERMSQIALANKDNFKDRYWGLENIKNTLVTDPVGFGLDAASLAFSGAGLMGKGPLASKAPAPSPAKVLGVGRPAVQKVAEAIKADRITPDQIADLGPEGMLMDAGPNLRKQGRGVFLHQGEGSQIIDEALKRRNEGTTGRAMQAADDALGPRVDAVEHRQRLKDARASNGSPLYNEAFENAKSVNTNPVIEAIDEVIAPNTAGAGPESMSPLGQKLTKYRSRLVNSRGQVTEGRVLQHTYQELGDDISEAVRKGRGNEARLLIEVKKKLEASIDEATQGGFSKANEQWATDSEILDAFGFGEDLARNNLTPDEVMARLGKMKPEARPQVLLGLRNWVYEVVGTARNDTAAARALLQRGWTQEKLGIVLGKDKAEALGKRIGLERTYAETNQRVRLNSNTAEGLSGAVDVADPSLLGKGNKEAFAYGGPMGLLRKKALDMVDKVVDKLASHRGDVTRADLAKLLSATGAERDVIVGLLTDPKTLEAFRGGSIPAKTVRGLLQGLVAGQTLEAVQAAPR